MLSIADSIVFVLGIDVEIDVEHKGKRKHCQRGGPWSCHMRGNFGGHGWGRGRGGFCQMGFPFGGYASAHAQAANAGCAFQGPPPPPEPQSHEMDTNSETGELRSGFQAPGFGVRMETVPSTNGEKAKASGSPEPSGWTLVIGDDEADVAEAASGVEKLQVSGPELEKDSAQPPSISKHKSKLLLFVYIIFRM